MFQIHPKEQSVLVEDLAATWKERGAPWKTSELGGGCLARRVSRCHGAAWAAGKRDARLRVGRETGQERGMLGCSITPGTRRDATPQGKGPARSSRALVGSSSVFGTVAAVDECYDYAFGF